MGNREEHFDIPKGGCGVETVWVSKQEQYEALQRYALK
jgi:hypothetical protein